MPQPLRLGFLTHLEGGDDPQRIYQETLELFVAADQLGFDVGWIAQHHLRTHTGRLPSPFPFLAAAAERTRQLRLGTAVVTLPLEHPLRVAEDAAVVDLLSAGRLELGVGSGTEAGEFLAFGLDPAERRQLTTVGIQRLQQALRGEPLNEAGDRLDPPAPALLDRLWQSGLSVTGVRYIAQQGLGLLLSRAVWESDQPTDQLQLPLAQAYQAAWQGTHGPARIGLSRGVYLAADKRSALAAMQAEVMRSAQAMIARGRLPAGQPLEYYCYRMHIAYGSPDEVAASLLADQVLPYTTDLMLQFNPVIPPLAQAIQMLERIATQVAPQLGWRAVQLG